MRFIKESLIRATPERVFAFHEQPDAFAQLLPPWERSNIIQPPASLQVGARTIIETKILGFINTRWIAEHTAYDPPRMFEDRQLSGPFHRWRHRHIIEPHAEGALLRDDIEYEMPLGFLTSAPAPLLVKPRLQRLFDYRHEITRKWCEREQ